MDAVKGLHDVIIRLEHDKRIFFASMRSHILPPRFPSYVVFGTGQSRLSDEDFFVGGTAIRFCHSEIERSCCRRERTVFPAITVSKSATGNVTRSYCRPKNDRTGGVRIALRHHTDLSGVDLISTKCIFVSTHRGRWGCVGFLAASWTDHQHVRVERVRALKRCGSRDWSRAPAGLPERTVSNRKFHHQIFSTAILVFRQDDFTPADRNCSYETISNSLTDPYQTCPIQHNPNNVLNQSAR